MAGKANGDQRCERCRNVQPPNSRQFVQGNVGRTDWRQLFTQAT